MRVKEIPQGIPFFVSAAGRAALRRAIRAALRRAIGKKERRLPAERNLQMVVKVKLEKR
ncbi:hypothetical protein [uncultured Alistipes sp.]|uniref:hypothetical protein n=1 Tax=uncultured Alistipes sp. TaxID=538949 RepID=UPI0025D19917|nr:hypothetical protein [uncultured Alistipes sp.]